VPPCSIDYRRVDPPHPRPDRYLTDWDRLFARMDLRVRQDEMLAAWAANERGLTHVPAGVGKTFALAGYALAHPNARIHIVTDGIDIVKRIEGHLTKYIPNVGQVGGGKRRFGPRVTVISADSLHVVGEGFDDPNSPQAADVVFFDEVHKAAAPSILGELRKYRYCRMFGLSANVGDRPDGADKQLTGLFGEVIYRLSYQQAEADGLVSPVLVEWVRMNFDAGPALADMRGDELNKWGVWRNEERNRRLGARLAAFGPDEQVLVMVDKAEHAVRLQQFLPGYKLVYDQFKAYGDYVKNGLIDPDQNPPMTPRLRDQHRRDFEARRLLKVIATDVWSKRVTWARMWKTSCYGSFKMQKTTPTKLSVELCTLTKWTKSPSLTATCQSRGMCLAKASSKPC
jgi:superfamily II DNA or RNA helicase